MRTVREFMNERRRKTGERRLEAWLSARGLCNAQGDQSIANQAGAAFRSDLNAELQALVTNSSGATAPATTYAHQWWFDTTTGTMKKRNAANSGWIVKGTLDETFVISRSSNTILGLSDVGKCFVATAAFTQTLTAAATLGDGWWCAYNANGNSIVFDPNASENIDGATTKTTTGSGIIYCNGSAFFTIGFPSSSAVTDTGINGTARALKCSITAASATATWTADEVVVETALGGTSQRLASYSQACNLGTTGAGGMDTGAAPASGFVSIYAIAKADGTKNILACNVTTSSGSIYGGANMPAGYTYSALISTWPTNGSSQFVVGYQDERLISIISAQALNNGTATSYTSISLTSLVPSNAKRVRGNFGVSVAGASGVIALASASASAIAEAVAGGSAATTGLESIATGGAGYELPLITAQTIYYKMESGTRQGQVWVSGYTI